MLDPRIYRTGLVVVALAVIVLAFSFDEPAGGAHVDACAGRVQRRRTSYTTMMHDGQGLPGPPSRIGGRRCALPRRSVTASLTSTASRRSTDTFTGRTADGIATLENVVATRPGMQSGQRRVVAAPRRRAARRPAAALSGTATLIELARDLAGETLNRTVVLASTSGSQGAAGAIRLASSSPGRSTR